MLSNQLEDQERRETLDNDRKVREQQQASTMHQHALAAANDESGGRYGVARPAPTVTGSTSIPQYPKASTPWQGPDPVGDEPPLSAFENPALDETSAVPPSTAGATGGAEALSGSSASSPDVEHAAPSCSSTEDGHA
jgi:hypothetical protein